MQGGAIALVRTTPLGREKGNDCPNYRGSSSGAGDWWSKLGAAPVERGTDVLN